MTAGRPPFFKSEKELTDKIEQYFKEEVGYESIDGNLVIKPPTVSGLALYLGFADRQSIYDYKANDKYSCIIKKSITKIEEFAEKGLLNGRGGTGAIFWLKNHGWTDKQVTEEVGKRVDKIEIEFVSPEKN